jgi:hypothetical protein
MIARWYRRWPSAAPAQGSLGRARLAGLLASPLGGVLVLSGALVLTGLYKAFEPWATAIMPEGWVRFVVQF